MGISLDQLETWSHVGAITCSSNTYNSIKTCIDAHKFPDGVSYNPYLQGSYGNFTNIRGDSDVDVVIELASYFQPNTSKLETAEKQIFERKYPDAKYLLSDFKKEVIDCFTNYYEPGRVSDGNKAIKIQGYSGRLDADVIVAIKYKYFWHVYEGQTDSYTEGIAFQNKNGSWIYSYPKAHFENGVAKMSLTNGQFKPLVRIYKNIRGKLDNNYPLADKFFSSYMIESLIYNVPDKFFRNSLLETFTNSIDWLVQQADLSTFDCQHGLFKLFGTSQGQCSIEDAKAFVNAVVELNKNW